MLESEAIILRSPEKWPLTVEIAPENAAKVCRVLLGWRGGAQAIEARDFEAAAAIASFHLRPEWQYGGSRA